MTPSIAGCRSTLDGMTLIELVVVMSIVALIAGIALPATAKLMDNRTEDESGLRIERLGAAIEAFAEDHLGLPTELRWLREAPPGGAARWRGPYIPQDFQTGEGGALRFDVDGWTRTIRWAPSGLEGTLRSDGSDAAAGTTDDLSLIVDIRPLLRQVTVERIRIINTAIVNYNLALQNTQPLTGTADQVLQRLGQAGYLPSGSTVLRSDAFGSAWTVRGDPVTAITSPNLSFGL